MRLLTFTSALALGLGLSTGAFAQTSNNGCVPKAHNTQGYPQGLNGSSQPHPRFTAGGGGIPGAVDSSQQPHPRFTAGGGGIPGAVESSQQPHPRFTAGGGGVPGGVYDSSQPHPRFTAGQQQYAQAGSSADPCK